MKHAVALRINQRGLDFIANHARPLIPNTVPVPPVKKGISLPLVKGAATLDLTNLNAKLKVHDLKLKLAKAGLDARARGDVVVHGEAAFNDTLLGLGDHHCKVVLICRTWRSRTGFRLSASSGKIKAQLLNLSVSFDEKQRSISLSNCKLGSIFNPLEALVRESLLGIVKTELKNFAEQKMMAAIVQKLSTSTQLSGQVKGYLYTVRLQSVKTDPQGIELTLDAGIATKDPGGVPPCTQGINQTPPALAGALAKGAREVGSVPHAMFGASLSRMFLNRVIFTVWRRGGFCLDSQTVKIPTLAPGLDQLGVILGNRPDVRLNFSFRLLSAPQVRRMDPDGIDLDMDRVEVTLNREPVGGISSSVVILASCAARVKPRVHPASRSINLELGKLAIRKIQLASPDGQPHEIPFDPAQLESYLGKAVLPLLSSHLSTSPASPAVLNEDGLLVELTRLKAHPSSMAVFLNGFKLNPSGDEMPPNTEFLNTPPLVVGPGVLRLNVKGVDNRTPTGLMRFRARLEGGPWNAPQYGGRIDATVYRGAHRVEVAAVDHAGNADPSPVSLLLQVDASAPRLNLTSWPNPVIDGFAAAVEFQAEDDLTPTDQISYEVALYRIPDGESWPKVVESRRLQPGSLRAEFNHLPQGVHIIRVTAADQVGNVRSRDVSFVVAGGASCTTAASDLSGCKGVLLLLGLFWLVATRAQRARP